MDEPTQTGGDIAPEQATKPIDYDKAGRDWELFIRNLERALWKGSDNTDGQGEIEDALLVFECEPVTQTLPLRAITSVESIAQRSPEIQRLFDLIREGELLTALSQPEMIYHLNNRESDDERHVTERARMARDIKILALGIEIRRQDSLSYTETDKTRTYTLPSGVQITFPLPMTEQQEMILHPELWAHRTELKDRIHRATIAGYPFIMKERREANHKAGLVGTYQPGLTSEEEFSLARTMKQVAEIKHPFSNIAFQAEEAIAYISFPDGYQFVLFNEESDLMSNGQELRQQLEQAVLTNMDRYRHIYEAIRFSSNNVTPDEVEPVRRIFENARESALFESTTNAGEIPEDNHDLTYADFAHAYAVFIINEINHFAAQVVARLGYRDKDLAIGNLFKITPEGNLICFIYDFEYFEKTTADTSGFTIDTTIFHEYAVDTLPSKQALAYAALFRMSRHLEN